MLEDLYICNFVVFIINDASTHRLFAVLNLLCIIISSFSFPTHALLTYKSFL